MSESPVFTRHNDGRLTVDRWVAEFTISSELLNELCQGNESGTPTFELRGDPPVLTIHVSNGHARSRYDGPGPNGSGCYVLEVGTVFGEKGVTLGVQFPIASGVIENLKP